MFRTLYKDPALSILLLAVSCAQSRVPDQVLTGTSEASGQATKDSENPKALYVQKIANTVSAHWVRPKLPPEIRKALVLTSFEILRDGTPANIHIEKPSGTPALDQSAIRAIQRIDSFDPLPSEYSGDKVLVDFIFNYQPTDTPSSALNGLSFPEAKDFGNRFGWYVQIISKKIAENWHPAALSSSAQARRVYVRFDIMRDGSPVDVHVEKSSGVQALDLQAVGIVQQVVTFGPLPPGYAGNKVA